MKKKIIIGLAIFILVILASFWYAYTLYMKYPPTLKTPEGACITSIATAHHPTFTFIKQTFGTPCVVPEGWVIEN